MTHETIVLAGGLGTRLRGVIGEIPKCMAPVSGQPFLHWLFRYLEQQGCARCVLSLGYRHEVVLDWLEGKDFPFVADCVVEGEPLGTGGGMALALGACVAENVFVVNGDTLFNASFENLLQTHESTGAETTLALKPMRNFDRYGTVQMGADNTILSFEEKAPRTEGLINGGVYVVSRELFLLRNLPPRFSLEKEYLEPAVLGKGILAAHTDNGYFIDIGVPEDFSRAQVEVPALFGA